MSDNNLQVREINAKDIKKLRAGREKHQLDLPTAIIDYRDDVALVARHNQHLMWLRWNGIRAVTPPLVPVPRGFTNDADKVKAKHFSALQGIAKPERPVSLRDFPVAPTLPLNQDEECIKVVNKED